MRHLGLVLAIMLLCSACSTEPSAVTPTEEPFFAWDFTLAAVDGEVYTLSEQRGKWVLVNFWATWCIPCIVEMPAIQSIADQYSEDLIVLAINQREQDDAVRAFIEKHNLRFPILLHPDDTLLSNYLVMNLPQTILVNPMGEIVWRQFGPIELDTFQTTLGSLFASYNP